MNLEQLSVFDLPQIVDYSERLEGGHVYPKIDWLTLVFTDTSINHVLRWFKQDASLGDFMNSMYDVIVCAAPSFVFTYCNIRIEVPQIFYLRAEDPTVPLFDQVVPRMRVDISGTGLDYLRSFGIDFIDYRFSNPDLGEHGEFHVTRCDWAFDFINYKPDFLDDFIRFLDENHLPSGRVPIVGTVNTAIKYSVRSGDQKTVYLGSTNSKKLLRVYDKKLQLCNPVTGVWMQNPYDDPESWIRIEWQTRSEVAHSLLMSKDPVTGEYNDFFKVLKQIYLTYGFASTSKDGYHNREDLAFWDRFLPWNEISSRIVQNAKYVRPKPLAEKVDLTVRMNKRRILEWIFTYGLSALISMLEDYLRSLDFENDITDPSTPGRRNVLMSELEELCLYYGIDVPTEKGTDQCLYRDMGRLHIALPRG